MKASALPISRIRDVFVMSCRCGRGLRPSDMHWFIPPRPVSVGVATIRQVCCRDCALGLSVRPADEQAGAA